MIVGVLVLVGGFALVVVRVGLLPLDRMGHTAAAIAGGDLSHRVETTDPRTEVGRLGLALNRMLDRLEDAFAAREASQERLRRFIADASHELRTPLVSIRGYAELFRMGAARSSRGRREGDAADRGRGRAHGRAGRGPADARAARRVARGAARRRRPVACSRATPSTTRARPHPSGRSTLEPRPCGVTGDADQLRQVLANLLRNALVHTPAGTPIEVSVERDDGVVRLQVRDHGPGLPTDEADALFERFWRAEGGRERGKDGAGLGLAIVAGIVDGHDGTVTAANAPGGGAAFEVRLPARV